MDSEKLKAIRSQLHVNQEDFAKKLGITQSYYSALERGDKQLTKKVLEKLFKNVGVSVQWWYSSNGDIFSTKMSGTNVGLNVGFEEKKYQNQQAAKRFFEELKIENPELSALFDDAFNVINFQFFIKLLSIKYLRTILLLDDVKEDYFKGDLFNYSQYKADHLKNIEKIKDLAPALHNLSSAIMQFYSEFAPFDKENIIADHFPGIKR